MAKAIEVHIKETAASAFLIQGEVVIATGWVTDPRYLAPGVFTFLHGDTPVQGVFSRFLPPGSNGEIRFELMMRSNTHPWRGRGRPATGYRWIGEDQEDLPRVPILLTPYRGKGNPPFLRLAESEFFSYPRPSSLHFYAPPTHSPRQQQFQYDLAKIAHFTNNRTVPYAFRDANGTSHRMTASAISYAVANGFISNVYHQSDPIRSVQVVAVLDTTAFAREPVQADLDFG